MTKRLRSSPVRELESVLAEEILRLDLSGIVKMEGELGGAEVALSDGEHEAVRRQGRAQRPGPLRDGVPVVDASHRGDAGEGMRDVHGCRQDGGRAESQDSGAARPVEAGDATAPPRRRLSHEDRDGEIRGERPEDVGRAGEPDEEEEERERPAASEGVEFQA